MAAKTDLLDVVLVLFCFIVFGACGFIFGWLRASRQYYDLWKDHARRAGADELGPFAEYIDIELARQKK